MNPHTVALDDPNPFFPPVFKAGVFPCADTTNYLILLQYPRFWSNIRTCSISIVLKTESIFTHYIGKFRRVLLICSSREMGGSFHLNSRVSLELGALPKQKLAC